MNIARNISGLILLSLALGALLWSAWLLCNPADPTVTIEHRTYIVDKDGELIRVHLTPTPVRPANPP